MTPMLLYIGDTLIEGRLRAFLMLALEATLEQNMKMVDNSVYKLFQGNREQMKNAKGDVSKFYSENNTILFVHLFNNLPVLWTNS